MYVHAARDGRSMKWLDLKKGTTTTCSNSNNMIIKASAKYFKELILKMHERLIVQFYANKRLRQEYEYTSQVSYMRRH